MKDLKNILLISAAVLVLLLPFINKPFHIDDPFYLKMAQQIIQDPARPYSFAINWSGHLRDAWTDMEATFPPLIPYYMALIIKLFGLKEWVLHLFFLPFALAAAIGMYFVSKKFVKDPLIPALFCAVSPVFLVSATGLMLDVPMLAFSLASLAFFLHGVDEDRPLLVAVSMLLCSAAILTKYTALVLIPLFASCLYFQRKVRFVWFLGIPALVLAGWCLHNYLVYGDVHLLLAWQRVGKTISVHKVMSLATFISGCFIFPVFSFLAFRKKRESFVAAFIFLALFILGYRIFETPVQAVMFSVLGSTTLLFLYKVVVLSRKADDKFLAVWFALMFLASVSHEPWTSARYILLLLPPSAILFVQLVEIYCGDRKRTLIPLSLGLTALFGVMLTTADYLWAQSYPRIASVIKERGYGQGYFIGHYGFQYYLESIGMKAFEVDEPQQEPGYVVISLVSDPQKPEDELFNKMKYIGHQSAASSFPVRLMSPWERAGFYSSFWGVFPFTCTGGPLDEFIIYHKDKTEGL